jgi:hypothetical protein
MAHVALLGDSVFDNAAYVAGGQDVVTQLRARLPNDLAADALRARWRRRVLQSDEGTLDPSCYGRLRPGNSAP